MPLVRAQPVQKQRKRPKIGVFGAAQLWLLVASDSTRRTRTSARDTRLSPSRAIPVPAVAAQIREVAPTLYQAAIPAGSTDPSTGAGRSQISRADGDLYPQAARATTRAVSNSRPRTPTCGAHHTNPSHTTPVHPACMGVTAHPHAPMSPPAIQAGLLLAPAAGSEVK